MRVWVHSKIYHIYTPIKLYCIDFCNGSDQTMYLVICDTHKYELGTKM